MIAARGDVRPEKDRSRILFVAVAGNRSFRLQFEINALIVNKDFGRQLEAMLENDMAHATPRDPTDLRDASFIRRLSVSVARLTAPLL